MFLSYFSVSLLIFPRAPGCLNVMFFIIYPFVTARKAEKRIIAEAAGAGALRRSLKAIELGGGAVYNQGMRRRYA
jgi:hypothetical protein